MLLAKRFLKYRVRFCLFAIVMGAVALSLRWVFLVPIYQAPDEPAHLDYALCIARYASIARFRTQSLPRPREYVAHYVVHPFSLCLLEVTKARTLWWNSQAKVVPGYGTCGYYDSINRTAISHASLPITGAPWLWRTYPFGYYALLALWIRVLELGGGGLVGTFFGARILSVVLLALGLVISYATARELHLPARCGLLITAAIGFFPLVTFVSSAIQPDNMTFAIVGLCFCLALRARRLKLPAPTVGLLGCALGTLYVTKQHVYCCVMIPVVALCLMELVYSQGTWIRRVLLTALLCMPSLVSGSVQFWLQGRASPVVFEESLTQWSLLHAIDNFKAALADFCIGPTSLSFWGVFGWMDTPLIIKNASVTAVIHFLLQIVTFVVLGLITVRFEQVGSRLFLIGRRGKIRQAVRLAVANPLVNGYYSFTACMFFIYVRTDNKFGAQGRHWMPMILPMFFMGLVYAPKAFTLPGVRRTCARALLTGLLLYCLLGSYYGVRSVKQRYYPSGKAVAGRESPPKIGKLLLHRP